jgi:hypothetical protein
MDVRRSAQPGVPDHVSVIFQEILDFKTSTSKPNLRINFSGNEHQHRCRVIFLIR